MTTSEMIEALEAQGYKVTSPPCSACKGSGYILKSGGSNCGTYMENCPSGCPQPMMFNDSMLGADGIMRPLPPVRTSIPRLGVLETEESIARRVADFAARA